MNWRSILLLSVYPYHFTDEADVLRAFTEVDDEAGHLCLNFSGCTPTQRLINENFYIYIYIR